MRCIGKCANRLNVAAIISDNETKSSEADRVHVLLPEGRLSHMAFGWICLVDTLESRCYYSVWELQCLCTSLGIVSKIFHGKPTPKVHICSLKMFRLHLGPGYDLSLKKHTRCEIKDKSRLFSMIGSTIQARFSLFRSNTISFVSTRRTVSRFVFLEKSSKTERKLFSTLFPKSKKPLEFLGRL